MADFACRPGKRATRHRRDQEIGATKRRGRVAAKALQNEAMNMFSGAPAGLLIAPYRFGYFKNKSLMLRSLFPGKYEHLAVEMV